MYNIKVLTPFKVALFTILDELEQRTRPLLEKARKKLTETKGISALEPHNTGYALSGDTSKLKVKNQ